VGGVANCRDGPEGLELQIAGVRAVACGEWTGSEERSMAEGGGKGGGRRRRVGEWEGLSG